MVNRTQSQFLSGPDNHKWSSWFKKSISIPCLNPKLATIGLFFLFMVCTYCHRPPFHVLLLVRTYYHHSYIRIFLLVCTYCYHRPLGVFFLVCTYYHCPPLGFSYCHCPPFHVFLIVHPIAFTLLFMIFS